VHTPAWTYCEDGYFYLIGGDSYNQHSEVWRTSLVKRAAPTTAPGAVFQGRPNFGDGTIWERRTTSLHPLWGNRALSIAGSLGGILYAMGGHLTRKDTRELYEAKNDVYESTNGGRAWRRMQDTDAEPPWSPRGMVFGMPVIHNPETGRDELYLVGGATYKSRLFDGVFALEQTTGKWITKRHDSPNDGLDAKIRPEGGWPTGLDENDPQSGTSGRGYHNVVKTPDGTIWVITGSVKVKYESGAIGEVGSCPGIIVSKDQGATWKLLMNSDWGTPGSHADGVTLLHGKIIRASGNAQDRITYMISRDLTVPPKPEVTPGSLDPPAGVKGTVVSLEGTFNGVIAVWVTGTNWRAAYADKKTITVTGGTKLKVTMPKFPGLPTEFPFKPHVVVVGPGGSSWYGDAEFTYLSSSP
jgi:hypothetical protein